MTKEKLNQKEQHYAGNRDQAEEIVLAAKDSIYLTMHKISEKHNKFGTYFLVDLTYSYNVPREIMENEANKPEVINDHEGIKATTDGSGEIYVDPNQISIDDVGDEPEEVEPSEDESSEVPF